MSRRPLTEVHIVTWIFKGDPQSEAYISKYAAKQKVRILKDKRDVAAVQGPTPVKVVQ